MINEFKNEYRFLSNFFPSPFVYEDISYPTVEHFFQAQKTLDNAERLRISRCRTPGIAKREGRKLILRQDWEQVKDSIMILGLMYKFIKYPDLAKKLKQTAGKHLEEGNTWGDTYWGVDLKTKVGKNILGQLLIVVRNTLATPPNSTA